MGPMEKRCLHSGYVSGMGLGGQVGSVMRDNMGAASRRRIDQGMNRLQSIIVA